jgi:hypothetical protein
VAAPVDFDALFPRGVDDDAVCDRTDDQQVPASVLTSTGVGPENGSVATGSSSITAGTFGTTFDSTSAAAKSGPGSVSANPCAASARACAAVVQLRLSSNLAHQSR